MNGSNLLVGLRHPLAGDVIPGAGAVARCAGRVLAWVNAAGAGNLFQSAGKRRDLVAGDLCQAVRGNIPAHLLKAIKEELDHD